MNGLFYIASAIAVIATFRALTGSNAVHSLLYLTVSLLASAAIFYSLGAHYIAALEAIIYAGAVMVLFLFVVMMLSYGPGQETEEKRITRPGTWAGSAVLAAILLFELVYVLIGTDLVPEDAAAHGPKAVGIALFGPYLIGVELASVLLLVGLLGAYHIGRK